MSDPSSSLVLLCAGGTGGHVFPALALAADLTARNIRVALATDSRGRRFGAQEAGLPVHVISSGVPGGGLAARARGVCALGWGVFQSAALLRRLRPAAVVGFGGYPSVPPVFAAGKMGIPVVLHEANAVLGKANAFLAGGAARIALSWPGTEGVPERLQGRCVVTGNPVRPDISALGMRPYPPLGPSGSLRIFVTGGSQGAKVFGSVVPRALAALPGVARARVEVVQQCLETDIPAVQALYDSAGIRAVLAPFFPDMAQRLAVAHLFIGRAGAATTAELAAAGRPAIYVPYPHHADQQQKNNADRIADAGGAWVMTESGFTVEALSARIETFLQTPDILVRAAEAARGCGRPDAALRLGNLIAESLAGPARAPRKMA